MRVAARPGEAHGSGGDALAQIGGEGGGGGDLDDLLVAALDAAVAFAEVGDGAAGIAGDLDLDVAGAGESSVRRRGWGSPKACPASEAQRSKAASISEASEIVRIPRPPPPPTALISMPAPSGRSAKKACASSREMGCEIPGDDRDVALASARERARVFVPKRIERLGGGADEGEAGLLAGAGEGRALGEEPVAGVDGVAARAFRGGRDKLVDIEVGGDATAFERVARHRPCACGGCGRRPRSARPRCGCRDRRPLA